MASFCCLIYAEDDGRYSLVITLLLDRLERSRISSHLPKNFLLLIYVLFIPNHKLILGKCVRLCENDFKVADIMRQSCRLSLFQLYYTFETALSYFMIAVLQAALCSCIGSFSVINSKFLCLFGKPALQAAIQYSFFCRRSQLREFDKPEFRRFIMFPFKK